MLLVESSNARIKGSCTPPDEVLVTGLEFTSREIVSKIHIGEATLAKRVSEFATTSAGSLTMTEFDTRSREMEIEQLALLENTPAAVESSGPGCHCIHIGK